MRLAPISKSPAVINIRLIKKVHWGLLLIIFLSGLIYISLPHLQKYLSAPLVYKASPVIEYVKTSGDSQIKPTLTMAILPGTKWIPQTFNNCGPATTSMVLQYFGQNISQEETKAALRTNSDDKNVFTDEMADYLRQHAVQSKLFYNGNQQILKALIANGFYVVVEDWLHPNEDIGHVTILRGYDDTQGLFIADDSYLGVNITYKYQSFDKTQWKAFNREYLPLFNRPGQESKLKSIVGENWDQRVMYQNSVDQALMEIKANQSDMQAYFNLGTSYFGLKEYQKAEAAFTKSQSLGWPKRMLWYQIQPVQTLNLLGKYPEAIKLADIGLWSNDSFAELHLEKAKAELGLNNKQSARDEINTTLKYSPNLKEAKDLSNRL